MIPQLPNWPEGWTPCRTMDPSWWFPEPDRLSDGVKAATLCKTQCPARIRDACAAYGLTNAVAGVWGGLSENQRRKIRHAKGISAKQVTFQPADRADVVMRMFRRGTPASVIAAHVELHEESVHRIIRESGERAS